jgi:hypothetical protein
MRVTLGRLMFVVAFLGFLAWFIRPGWVVVFGSIDVRILVVASICVLISKIVGQIWVARRLWLGKPILAGEWLWLGSSTSFFVGFCCLTPVTSHGRGPYQVFILYLIAEVFAAILLALFGRRPGPRDPAWAHYAGWFVIASDALLFGLFARDELLH